MHNELKDMLQSVIHEALVPIQSELQKLNERVTKIETNMVTKTEMNEFRTEMKTEMNEFRTETTIRLNGFHEEMKEFREEVRADLKVLKGGQQGIRAEISDRFAETKARDDLMDHRIRNLESGFFLLLEKTNEHEREINRLKRAE